MNLNFDSFNAVHTDLQLSATIERKVLIISAVGSIDTYNSAAFCDASKTIISKNVKDVSTVVFDMNGITYVSSTGIGSFTSLLAFCSELKLEMHIWRVQEKVLDVFQLLGFNSFIHFIQDLDEIEIDSTQNTVEPKIAPCPYCNKLIKIVKAGKFKCGACKGIIIVNDNMEINRDT